VEVRGAGEQLHRPPPAGPPPPAPRAPGASGIAPVARIPVVALVALVAAGLRDHHALGPHRREQREQRIVRIGRPHHAEALDHDPLALEEPADVREHEAVVGIVVGLPDAIPHGLERPKKPRAVRHELVGVGRADHLGLEREEVAEHHRGRDVEPGAEAAVGQPDRRGGMTRA